MRFKTLEVYELVTDNDHEKTATFNNVNITYADQLAWAEVEGKHIAHLSTFDDDPLKIAKEALVISGILGKPKPTTPEAYGYWKLT
jgi:hypothetical protein